MSDARTAILNRVRRAQRTGRIPSVTDRPDIVGSGLEEHHAVTVDLSAPSTARVRDRFLAELALLGVTAHVEESADAVRARVTAIVGNASVLAWDAQHLPYDVGAVLPGACTGSSSRAMQAAADIGVTGCDVAVAETGSLMLLSGDGKPRAASLLPLVHIAIVRLSDLRFSMGECLRERAAEISAAACCTFVTGPSRTADIELTLTLGVHGPARVIVIVGP